MHFSALFRDVRPLPGALAAALFVAVLLGPADSSSGQFSDARIIHAEAGWGETIKAADLDGDGDEDLLLAAPLPGNAEVAWFERLGDGTFGPKQVISETDLLAATVYPSDVDADGDLDVVWGSWADQQLIGWFENRGDGSFEQRRIISREAASTKTVTAGDVDQDGYPDVLSASFDDDTIAWYRNRGGNSFGSQRIVNEPDPDGRERSQQGNADGATSVHPVDLNGDGRLDVLTGSYADGKVAWHENIGAEFGAQQVIMSEATSLLKVTAADIDDDGMPDVLAAYEADHGNVSWFENRGGGKFSERRVISPDSSGATSVRAVDLDGDGDLDVAMTSEDDDTVAWFEHTETGFGPQQVVSTAYPRPDEVVPSDVDGDGDEDLIVSYSSDQGPEKVMIAWFENTGIATAGEVGPDVPTEFELEGNYPNPLNPTTTIAYALPRSQSVHLAVFDRLGRRVATLVDGRRGGGRHEVRFEAGGLPSGVYVYRLETRSFVRTRSMTVLE